MAVQETFDPAPVRFVDSIDPIRAAVGTAIVEPIASDLGCVFVLNGVVG